MLVNFYNFSKKKNSTAGPIGGQVNSVQAYLKDDTSVLHPTLVITTPGLGGGGDNDFSNWTYANIPAFNRYYFVNDIVSVRNKHVEVSLSVDVLRTYKPRIAASKFLIERSSSECDEFLSDTQILAKSGTVIAAGHSESSMGGGDTNWSPTEGCYVLSVTGAADETGTASTLGITSYAVSRDNIQSVLNFMYSDTFFNGVADEVVKWLFNPFQYIVGIKWLPLTAAKLANGSSAQHVKIGRYDTGITAPCVNLPSVTFVTDLTMPALEYSDFRNYDPRFTSYQLYVPGCGAYSFNRSQIEKVNDPGQPTYLRTKYTIDTMTGDVFCQIYNSSAPNSTLAVMNGKVGVDVQIGQNASVLNTILGGVDEGIAGGRSIAAGNYGAGAKALAQGALTTATAIMQPTPSSRGIPGSMGTLTTLTNFYIWAYQLESIKPDDINNECGRPLMQPRTIGDLDGYIKCVNASINCSCYDEERDQINNYLNGGFYYED